MSIFRNVYEMPPIDFWDKAISLETAYGMLASDVRDEVNLVVHGIEQEFPHTIMCGVVGNPDSYNFEIVVYAKVNNNGTVYAFTNAELQDDQITKITIQGGLF